MKSDAVVSTTAGASFNISRRRFLQSVPAFAALAAFLSLGTDALEIVNIKPKGLSHIIAGWHNQSDR